MTTSVLSTHTQGYLNEYDLQVLNDFAREAPWEWRCAFERLLEDAERALEVEDLHDKIIELRDTMKDNVGELETIMKKPYAMNSELLEDLKDLLASLQKAAST